MNIKIKQITKDEIHLVVELFDKYRMFYHQTSDLSLASNYLQDRLDHGESIVFVAFIDIEQGQTPVGFTQLYPHYSSIRAVKNWILNDLFVEPAYRKTGIGKRLIDIAIDFAVKNKAKSIELSTAVDNHAAQSLYEQLGFVRQKPDEEFYTYQLALTDKVQA